MHCKITTNCISGKIKLLTISWHLSKQTKLQKKINYMSPYFVLKCRKKMKTKKISSNSDYFFFLPYLLFRHLLEEKTTQNEIALQKFSLFSAI